MKLPDKVRIQGADWEIRADHEQMDTDDTYGQSQEVHLRILIDDTRPIDRQRACLLHELFHAYQSMNVAPKQRLTEAQVKFIAASLFQILSDNPDVARFICGLEKEVP